MKRGNILIFLVLGLFLFSSVSAATSQIKVKTLPFHDVVLSIMSPDEISSTKYETFKGITDYYGDISFDYSSNEHKKFRIYLFVKMDGKNVIMKTDSEIYNIGESIEIRETANGFELRETPSKEIEQNLTEISETQNNTEILNQTAQNSELDSENKTSKITGFVSKSLEIAKNKFVYYSVLGVLILGIFVFFIMKKAGKPKEKYFDEDYKKKSLADAERKIKEAQEEIRKLKGDTGEDEDAEEAERKRKIAEIKKKLIEDEKALMDLRKGKK
jgi:hypothetical protein